jgi:uncharacterized protein (DUF952 family)
VERFIFHIATSSAWVRARAVGAYEPPSLAADGFIHFSDIDQVVRIANIAFRGAQDLVLLCVATERLRAPLRYESSEKAGEGFPHLYGALNLDAVEAVLALIEGPSGFAVPPQVRDLGR